MKHRWYGDHRDLVKWGSVMRIARENRLRWIVQIAFLTKDSCIPSVANSSGARPLDGHVLSHFRDIGLVAGLGKKSGIRRRDKYAKPVPGASVDTFWSPDGAKKVAFFAARKPVA